jgi:hypothetical protein
LLAGSPGAPYSVLTGKANCRRHTDSDAFNGDSRLWAATIPPGLRLPFLLVGTCTAADTCGDVTLRLTESCRLVVLSGSKFEFMAGFPAAAKSELKPATESGERASSSPPPRAVLPKVSFTRREAIERCPLQYRNSAGTTESLSERGVQPPHTPLEGSRPPRGSIVCAAAQ